MFLRILRTMRTRSECRFSYVRLETRIPTDHPLRAIRELVDSRGAAVRQQVIATLGRFDELQASGQLERRVTAILA